MKKKTLMVCLASAIAAVPAISAADVSIAEGAWTIEMPEATKVMTISHNGVAVFNGAYASATYNFAGETTDYTVSTLDPEKMPAVTAESITDDFGSGKAYIFTYPADGAELRHKFIFYSDSRYMLVQAEVASTDTRELQSRSLTALAVSSSSIPITGTSSLRSVWVPFDNDGHVKYEINMMNGVDRVSHEVGYVFDGESRRGLVAGSIDHDKWKSGVRIVGTQGYRLDTFTCLSGFTNEYTRDVLPHGKVKGLSVASARFFVGMYDDWREGLNDFATANTIVAPRLDWPDGNPMGWNSWGVQQQYVNYDGVYDTAKFIKEELFDLGFHDRNGRTVISLDSFAEDNIPSYRIYNLGTKVFGEGTYREGLETKEGFNQILGQYCGPFVIWDWSLDGKIAGTGINGTKSYTFRDAALKVNGQVYKVPSNGGCASDPTHPGLRANIEYFMRVFAENGTKYIKVDFLNNGIVEGDSWYDPEVTTGVMAYNYGMKILREEAAKYGMYVVESISPIFPYGYAHGRRTCCDRFSTIGETEYVMNAISYGWWTDRLYTVNDPDQLVMCKGGYGARETIGENRARATSGMTTGAFIFGDNFSDNVKNGGSTVGYPAQSRERAYMIMGNEDINEYVRTNIGSFMPVDGHKPSESQKAESKFVRRTGNKVYLAIFNYNATFSSNGSVDYSRISLTDEDEITEIKELWTGEIIATTAGVTSLSYSVPAKDVRVYRFTLAGEDSGNNSVEDAVKDSAVNVVRTGCRTFEVKAPEEVSVCRVYDIFGKCVADPSGRNRESVSFSLEDSSEGIYLVNIALKDGKNHNIKIINR